MKLIIAIIQPFRLELVKEELYKAQVNLITVSEVLGHGRQRPRLGVQFRRGGGDLGRLLTSVWSCAGGRSKA